MLGRDCSVVAALPFDPAFTTPVPTVPADPPRTLAALLSVNLLNQPCPWGCLPSCTGAGGTCPVIPYIPFATCCRYACVCCRSTLLVSICACSNCFCASVAFGLAIC